MKSLLAVAVGAVAGACPCVFGPEEGALAPCAGGGAPVAFDVGKGFCPDFTVVAIVAVDGAAFGVAPALAVTFAVVTFGAAAAMAALAVTLGPDAAGTDALGVTACVTAPAAPAFVSFRLPRATTTVAIARPLPSRTATRTRRPVRDRGSDRRASDC
jgi:hypothetical protein